MGKKKKKVQEEIPLEKMEYYKMKINDLKSFILKLSKELNATRQERSTFEIDRDHLTHYWGNTVYQLIKLERDIRIVERNHAHTEQILSRNVIQKQYELVDERYYSLRKLASVKEGYVKKCLSKFRDVYKTEHEVFGDQMRAKNDYWNTYLQSEVGIMRMKYLTRSKDMNNILQAYKQGMMQTVDQKNKLFQQLCDRLESGSQTEFRKMVLMKNKKVHSLQNENDKKIEGIQTTFENVRNNEFVLEMRRQFKKCKEESAALGEQLSEILGMYERCLQIKKLAEQQVVKLSNLNSTFDIVASMTEKSKQKYKEISEYYSYLSLKMNVLENYLEGEKNNKKLLRKYCLTEIMHTRQRQIRIHLALESLMCTLAKEVDSEQECLIRYENQTAPDIIQFKDLYNRYLSGRLSLLDAVEGALISCGSNMANLGFIPKKTSFAKTQCNVAILPPLPPEPRAPTRRPRIEWGPSMIELRPPYISRGSKRT